MGGAGWLAGKTKNETGARVGVESTERARVMLWHLRLSFLSAFGWLSVNSVQLDEGIDESTACQSSGHAFKR